MRRQRIKLGGITRSPKPDVAFPLLLQMAQIRLLTLSPQPPSSAVGTDPAAEATTRCGSSWRWPATGATAAAAPAPWRPQGSRCALGATASRVPPRACSALRAPPPPRFSRACRRGPPLQHPRRRPQASASFLSAPGRAGHICSGGAAILLCRPPPPAPSPARPRWPYLQSKGEHCGVVGHRSRHRFGSEGDEMSGCSQTEGSKRVDERNSNCMWTLCSSAARRKIPIACGLKHCVKINN